MLAPRLLDGARAATISDLLAALGRTAPRPPPGARPPDPPTSMTTEPTLRDLLGKPVIVLSGYRSPEHNLRVGGASAASKHMDGTAFDIAMANHDPVAFERRRGRSAFSGSASFIHIDLGPARTWGIRFPPG